MENIQMMNKYVGEIIRETRKRKGLSQTVLGDLVGMSAATIHRIEHGEKIPTDAEITAIAEQLSINSTRLLEAALFTREQQPTIPPTSYKTVWQTAHPSHYSGPVWIQITPLKENRKLIHQFQIRWNVWERMGEIMLTDDQKTIFLAHYKHNDGLGLPLFLTLSYPCYVVFGKGEPPDKAMDINFQWVRFEPMPPNQLWLYVTHYIAWFFKHLTNWR